MFRVGGIVKKLDALTGSAGSKFAVNSLIGEYGKMLELKIDHANRTVRASIMLKGEREPIDIKIEKYSITNDGDDASIVIEEAETSREWLNAALKNFVLGQPLPLPAKYINLIEGFLA
jgi:hypothetical protein